MIKNVVKILFDLFLFLINYFYFQLNFTIHLFKKIKINKKIEINIISSSNIQLILRIWIKICFTIFYCHSLCLFVIKFLLAIDIWSWQFLSCLIKVRSWRCESEILLMLVNWWDSLIHISENIWLFYYFLWFFNRIPFNLNTNKIISFLIIMCFAPFHQSVIKFHLISLSFLSPSIFEMMNLFSW